MLSPAWELVGYIAIGAVFVGIIVSMWFAMKYEGFGGEGH